MLELDQILRANELSISLMAAVPGLLLSWGLVRGMWLLLLAPRPPDPRREALPCRCVLWDSMLQLGVKYCWYQPHRFPVEAQAQLLLTLIFACWCGACAGC
jgi:hypothetical protein